MAPVEPSIRVYNTETRKKEPLELIEPGRVRMYVCGVTVYAPTHVGHARAALTFDIVYRHLLRRNLEVHYVRNFTDVDDKIIDKAIAEGVEFTEIAERYIEDFYLATDGIFLLRPDDEPRVSDYMDQILELVAKLIENGHAYAVDGDVYYDVKSKADYGRLSRRKLEDQEEGARVEVDERKRHPFDFALWKSTKPGEPAWDSPWGPGRPGWHIECSAMSTSLLGPQFDIHGGGIDLVFPHHENEIAQTEGATGQTPCVRHWLHNGHLGVNQEKMSKSLGNFFRVSDIIVRYHPESLRLFFLSTHYRGPIDFSEEAIDEAEQRLERLYGCLGLLDQRLGGSIYHPQPSSEGFWTREQLYQPTSDPLSDAPAEAFEGAERGLFHQCEGLLNKFDSAMDDDFNTAGALGHVFDFVRKVNRWLASEPELTQGPQQKLAEAARDRLLRVGASLGLFHEPAAEFFDGLRDRRLGFLGIDEAEIEDAIQRRLKAREARDFPAADAIRDELIERGVGLKDGPAGTTWVVQRGLSLSNPS